MLTGLMVAGLGSGMDRLLIDHLQENAMKRIASLRAIAVFR
jgi:hypothetical protein